MKLPYLAARPQRNANETCETPGTRVHSNPTGRRGQIGWELNANLSKPTTVILLNPVRGLFHIEHSSQRHGGVFYEPYFHR